MLAVRIIPSILCRGRQQVKGKKFDSWRSVGLAAQAVRVHQQRGVDEVCLLDVGATPEGRGPDLGLIEELTDELFCPLSVGGGVRSLEDVKNLLRAGADKVVIGTAAWQDTKFIGLVADAVGSQAVVAALDVIDEDRFAIACGTKIVHVRPLTAARVFAHRGAGEILLTSIDREGTLEGYDLKLIEEVSKAVSIPVIAHGGCKNYQDMCDAIRAGASAVAAGALFQFTDSTPKDAAKYLKSVGIEARL